MHDSRNSPDHVINCSRWLGNLIIMLKMFKIEKNMHIFEQWIDNGPCWSLLQQTIQYYGYQLWLSHWDPISCTGWEVRGLIPFASVLALCPSCCRSLASSKYLVPRATDIQTNRKQHKEWWGGRHGGRSKNFKSSFWPNFTFCSGSVRKNDSFKYKITQSCVNNCSIVFFPVYRDNLVKFVKYLCYYCGKY